MKRLITCSLLSFFIEGASADPINERLAAAALERTTQSISYDGSYHSITYPGGDVPADIGVCTDVVVRAYRSFGIDLQKLVHEDMSENFHLYPSRQIWGLQKPDTNIDHRRVPNLQVFFKRFGEELSRYEDRESYGAGDIVTWMLPGNLPHIGILSNEISDSTGNRMVVHNIGAGPKLEYVLFDYPMTGHYRYFPDP